MQVCSVAALIDGRADGAHTLPVQAHGGAAQHAPVDAAARLHKHGARHMVYLRLRGGEDEADEYTTPTEKLDSAMNATIGRSVWGLIKAMLGWHSNPRPSPSQDLKELQDAAEAKRKRGQIIDRKWWYFISKGPIYALNPLTHLSRFIAGTEKTVQAAVLFVNAERASMPVPDIRAKLMAPKSKGGMGLTKTRVLEVFYRAALDFSEEDMAVQATQTAFGDEEDAELEAFKKKALENAAKKGGGKAASGERKLHAAATKKWTGSSGNVVKRLQKELIGIQSTGRCVWLCVSTVLHVSCERLRRQTYGLPSHGATQHTAQFRGGVVKRRHLPLVGDNRGRQGLLLSSKSSALLAAWRCLHGLLH